MSYFKVLTLLTAASLSVASFAQDSTKEKKTKDPEAVEDVKPTSTAAKPVDEADQVITNRRLRAQSGSLSKWSGNIIYNYQAGSVEKPFAAQRPNIVSGADALTLQYMSANVGIRYRFNPLNSLTVATGMFMSTPFNNSIKTNDPALRDEF